MFMEADDALFRRILYNKTHVFFMRTYLRGHKSLTPSVLKLITSLSFAKLVT